MLTRRLCHSCLTNFSKNLSQKIILNTSKNLRYSIPLTTNVHTSANFLAKGGYIDKKKDSKGKKKVEINQTQLREIVDVDKLKTQLRKCVEDLKQEYIKKLSLRSTTGSIESLAVDVDGKEYSLQELAQIVRKNPTTVVINLSNFPQAIPNVLQSIRESGMNLNPQQEGTTLYIPVPRVTKEHRENLAKNAKMLFVKCKDHIKNTQNEHIKKIKKQSSGVSEDLVRSCQGQITALADQHVLEAEQILTTKQAELLNQ